MIKLIREGDFRSLGLLSHQAEKMLVALYDPKYIEKLSKNRHISCVITASDLAEKIPGHLGMCVCDDPITIFYNFHDYLDRETNFYWKDFDLDISSDAIIHKRAFVEPKKCAYWTPLVDRTQCDNLGAFGYR